MKRIFDLLFSCLGLLLLSPFFAVIALAIKLESPGPVFFRGPRLGRGAKPFQIYKFRTMVSDAPLRGGPLTHRDDPRVTQVGHFLRRTKLDELPQLVNVIWGEMSLVGPRPEDPRFLSFYTDRQRSVLGVRPGMTSIASIRYRNESELLAPGSSEQAYIESILPTKLDLELSYIENPSFTTDLMVLLGTFLALLRDESLYAAWTVRMQRVEQFVSRHLSWMAIDFVLVLAGYLAGVALRSITASFELWDALGAILPVVAVYLFCNHVWGIYHRVWRHASAQESVILFASSGSATILVAGVMLIMPNRVLPLGVVVMGALITLALEVAVRYRRQLARGTYQMLEDELGFASARGARVLIVGAGEEGQLLAWQLQNRLQGRGYQVVGFVDSDLRKQGMRLHNVKIYGDRRQIPELVSRLHIDLIIIAIPPHKVRDPRELLALCRQTSAQVKILPSLFEWLGRSEQTPGWQDLTEDALLDRKSYHVDADACRGLVSGREILVTGAAGSIGSELCRQLADYAPTSIILLDINESGLYDLQVELRAKRPGASTELALCDITDHAGIRAILARTRPQIVFHTAAYKHVPILEEQPREGVRVNVLGTKLLQALAQEAGVERFVLISSDKAVNPINVLGWTKWLAEVVVLSDLKSAMRSTVVRFGNVLGSRGSVVSVFEKQIDLGGPLTITHPDMTRYFLTISEAVSLVIQAAAITRGGDLYVLEMGAPIRILDLAHRLIRRYGLRPETDIPIQIMGLRPGEKLCEELVASDEERTSTEHPSIYQICRTRPYDLTNLNLHLDVLADLSRNGTTPPDLRRELRRCVEECRCEPRVVPLLPAHVAT